MRLLILRIPVSRLPKGREGLIHIFPSWIDAVGIPCSLTLLSKVDQFLLLHEQLANLFYLFWVPFMQGMEIRETLGFLRFQLA